MAPPTFLMVGATGNTGKQATRTLSSSLSSSFFSGHRILVLTRSSKGASAQELAKLPSVEVEEYFWPDITDDWLKERNVVRAFIASNPHPGQFAEEAAFHNACLRAGVEYVVRISTTAPNVRPDCLAFYPRNHWAIEALLGSPEFGKLNWSALQPNGFGGTFFITAAAFIKEYRKTGKQGTLSLASDPDQPVGLIDADDVGAVAGKLLLEQDTKKFEGKLVLNGPEDVTGRDVVKLVEDRIGAKVDDVKFRDLSFVTEPLKGVPDHKVLWSTLRFAMETSWEGKASAATTSREVLEIAAPKTTPAEMLDKLLKE